MSYEREAIAPSPSSNPLAVSAPEVFREERVMDPYLVRAPRLNLKATEAPPQRSIGQSDTRESLPVETRLTEETVKLSPQVAALARREQKFRSQQHQLEKDRAALTAEKLELAQIRTMKDKLQAKDYSAIDELVDYNEWSQYKVNKLNGADPVRDEIKRLNDKFNDLEKNTQDNVTKQFDAAVNERRIATKQLIEQGSFPKIQKAKAQEHVVQHILDTWEHDSEELTIEQAAKEVEEILIEKANQWRKLLEDEKEAEADKRPLPPLKPGLRTLTNQVTSGDLKRPNKPLHLLNDADRYAEARRRAEERLRNGQ